MINYFMQTPCLLLIVLRNVTHVEFLYLILATSVSAACSPPQTQLWSLPVKVEPGSQASASSMCWPLKMQVRGIDSCLGFFLIGFHGFSWQCLKDPGKDKFNMLSKYWGGNHIFIRTDKTQTSET